MVIIIYTKAGNRSQSHLPTANFRKEIIPRQTSGKSSFQKFRDSKDGTIYSKSSKTPRTASSSSSFTLTLILQSMMSSKASFCERMSQRVSSQTFIFPLERASEKASGMASMRASSSSAAQNLHPNEPPPHILAQYHPQ